ncbi:MAG: hypothetical protein JW761_05360, partial [Prolixibacteraceae bacterium]|nr:hypothetical protein [Prolixibacteraceae bacterium]
YKKFFVFFNFELLSSNFNNRIHNFTFNVTTVRRNSRWISLFEPERFKIWTAKVVILNYLANKTEFSLHRFLQPDFSFCLWVYQTGLTIEFFGVFCFPGKKTFG